MLLFLLISEMEIENFSFKLKSAQNLDLHPHLAKRNVDKIYQISHIKKKNENANENWTQVDGTVFSYN